MALFNAIVDIALAAVLLALAAQLIRRKLIDDKKMKEQQNTIKEHQKKMRELAGKNDPKSKAELQKAQNEMLEITGDMMQGSMKMMLYSFPLYIGAFWLLGYLYETAVINLPVPVPWFGENFSIKLYEQTNWVGWYVLIALISGIVLSVIFKVVDKSKVGK